MSWQDLPQAGEVWCKRVKGKQETRHVTDRALGGDVCYRKGRWRDRWRNTCFEDERRVWVKGAKRIDT